MCTARWGSLSADGGALPARQGRANRSQMLQLQETGQSLYIWENLKEFWKSHKSWTGAFYQPLIYHGLLITLTGEVVIHMYGNLVGTGLFFMTRVVLDTCNLT